MKLLLLTFKKRAPFLRSELRRALGEGESNSKQNVVKMVEKKEINVNFQRDRSSSKQFRFNPNCDNVVKEAQNYCHFIDRLISYHSWPLYSWCHTPILSSITQGNGF